MKSLYEHNIDLIRTLDVSAQWACEMMANDCWNLNRQFRITSARRSKQEQARLYAIGRTTPGKKVTWTLDSNHVKGLAIDLYPVTKKNLDTFYREIDSIANIYGIYRDPALMKLGDLGHYDCTKAIQKPTPSIPKSVTAAARKLERELRGAKSPRKERLENRKEGLTQVKGK